MSHLGLWVGTQRMSQRSVVSSPATGGFRGNGRKANLQERSYE